ncbi:hypothetical protein D3C76_1558160 [compost metagenome]
MFNGMYDDVQKFVYSLNRAIHRKVYMDKELMYELTCQRIRNRAAIQKIGIEIGDIDSDRLNKAIYDILSSRKPVALAR